MKLLIRVVAMCLTVIFSSDLLIAQPVSEPTVDLGPSIAILKNPSTPVSTKLTLLRGLATHRHLFAKANRAASVSSFRALLIDPDEELAQAAAAVFYLSREPSSASSGPVQLPQMSETPLWLTRWAMGLKAHLSEADRRVLVKTLEKTEGAQSSTSRIWSVFALARHKSSHTSLAPALHAILARGTPDQKVLAAQQLSASGVPQDLATVLRARDACPKELRHHYSRAIIGFPWSSAENSIQTFPRLLGGLKDADLDVRSAIVDTISKRPVLDMAAVRILVELLESDDGSRLGTHRGLENNCIQHLAGAKLATTRLGFADLVLPALERLLQRESQYRGFTDLLTELGAEAHSLKPVILSKLQDPSWLERRFAVLALGNIGFLSQEDLKGIERLLSDEAAVVRRIAATTLGKAKNHLPSSTAALFRMIEAGDSSASEGLGLIAARDEAVLHRLANAPIKDADHREAVAMALSFTGRSRDPRVVRWFIDALSKTGSRYLVIQSIKRLRVKDERIVKALVALLDDAQARVSLRIMAAFCLSKLGLGADQAIPFLQRQLGTIHADFAILGLVGFPALPASVVETIANHVVTQPKGADGKDLLWKDVDSEGARALGSLGAAGAPAIPILLEALDHVRPYELGDLLDALGNIGQDPGGVATALRRYTKHENEAAAKAAHLALRKIGAR